MSNHHAVTPADVIITEPIRQLDVDLACRALGYTPEHVSGVLMVPGRVLGQTIRAGRLTVDVAQVEGWADDPRQGPDLIDLARAYLADRYPGQDVSRVVAALLELEAAR